MKVLIALMALVVVASALTEEEEVAADVALFKRDPVLQDYFMAEKRGRSMKKYKCEYPTSRSLDRCGSSHSMRLWGY